MNFPGPLMPAAPDQPETAEALVETAEQHVAAALEMLPSENAVRDVWLVRRNWSLAKSNEVKASLDAVRARLTAALAILREGA